MAIAWDGSNLLSSSLSTDIIYKHSGFSDSILDSFAPPGHDTHGLAWYGGNLYSCDCALDKVYKHDGFSSTILDSFTSPDTTPYGLAWDNGNLLSAGNETDKIYKHDGFSASIIDSFFPPGTIPSGLAWYGGNLYSGDGGLYKFYKHDGFSSTIIDSFNSPYNSPTGVAWALGISPPSQFGRPNGDITVGSWSPFPSSPTTLWDKIDEQFRNGNTDYIESDLDEDECELSLTDVTDPETGLNHVIRCYAKCPAGKGKAEKLYIALVENGTVRAQSPATAVERTGPYWTLIEYTLSEAEANAIQNYANLSLRFHIVDVSEGEPIRVTQAEFRCSGIDEEEEYKPKIMMWS